MGEATGPRTRQTATPPHRGDLTRSVGWLLAGHVATLLVGFVTAVVIAHAGADELGRWRFAQAILTYLLVGSDAGLTLLAVREIARRPEDVESYAGPVLFVRGVLATVTLGVCWLVVDPLRGDPGDWFYVAMFLMVLPAAFSLIHVVQGLQQMRLYAILRVLAGAFASIIGLAAYILTDELVLLVLPAVGLGLVIDAALAFYLRRRVPLRFSMGTPRMWFGLLGPGVPFLVGAVSIQLISNADAVIIGTVRGQSELGIYAAAYVLAGQLLFLSGPIASAAYPRLAELHERTRGFADATARLSGALGLFAIPACVAAALLAPALIPLIYGGEYERAVPVLAILMGMPAIGFYNVAMSQALNAARHHGAVARVAVLAAAVSVTLNLILVPVAGLLAAAAVAVLCELVTAVAYTRVMRPLAAFSPLRAYVGAIDAVLLMAVVLAVARTLPLPMAALAAAAAYTIVVFVRRPEAFHTVRRLPRR